MRMAKTVLAIALIGGIGACGRETGNSEGAGAVMLSGDVDAVVAADKAVEEADQALANADKAMREIETKSDVSKVSQFPYYNYAAYCQQIGETAGGSSVIEKTCRDMEAEASEDIRSQEVSERIRSYCDEIGKTAGGSYVIYKTCVEMELDASAAL